MTEWEILNAARYLCKAVGWTDYEHLSSEQKRKVHEWSRGVLVAAAEAPVPPPKLGSPEEIWRAIVEASSA